MKLNQRSVAFFAVILVALCISITPNLKAQDDFAVEPVGQFGGGPVTCGDAQNNVAYIGQGKGLSIYEIQNESISQLSHIYLTKSILDLQAVGNYLYALLEYSGGFYVIDISNPATPDTVGSCDIETKQTAGIYVAGQYVYIVAQQGKFQIIDVSNPAAPTIAKTVNLFYPDDIFVANGFAYTVTSSTSPAKFRIFDLSDPLDPKYKGQLNIEAASKVTVSGNYAYISCSHGHGRDLNGLRIIDVSDPTNPVEQSYFSTADATYSSVIEGNYAYVGMEDSLLVLDISDKSAPQKVGDYEIPDAAWSKVRCFHYASSQVFLAVHGEDLPLQILDVSDPANPQPAASYNAPDAVISLRTGDSHLYVTSFDKLLVYDLSNPSSPAFLKGYEEFNNLGFMQFENSTLFGIGGQGGDKLVLINATDVNNLVQTGEYPAQSSWFGHFVVDQNRAYLQTHDKRLEIADISDPGSPQYLGETALAGEPRDIAVKDTQVYSAYRNSETERGVEIFSVSSPDQPSLLSTIATAGTPNALWIDADTLYVGGNTTDEDYFLQAFLITDPATPQLLAGANGNGKLWDLEVRNSAILAAVEGGSVLRFALNAVASILQQVAECHSPGSLQITTTPPDENGDGTLYTSEGQAWSSPSKALDKKRKPGRVEGAQSTMGMSNYGEYGVAIQKFKTKKPGPIPTLTLSKNSVQYEPICPVCDTCEVEATIAQVTIAVDEVDSWLVATIKFQAFGSGDEANDVRTAVLYEGGTVLDSAKYTADDGSVTLSINKPFQPGEIKHFRLTYKFKPDMQPINKIREYNVTAWIGWLVAEPDNYAKYKMLPPNPFDNGTQLIAPVKNLQTAEYFANIQDAIDDDDTKDGHTISVCPGVYIENVDVTKSLIIRSRDGYQVTTVQAQNSADHVFHVMKENTVIEGFSIEMATEQSGVYIYGSVISNCGVRHCSVNHNQKGIFINSATNCKITGNEIVFNGVGVLIKNGAKENIIGGTTDVERNIISGNELSGVEITGEGTEENKVLGNYIGTDKSGTKAVCNKVGVSIWNEAKKNTIGGKQNGEGNVISGNTNDGIYILDSAPGKEEMAENEVLGNYIGINKDCTSALPNGENGVIIDGSRGNWIGRYEGGGNVISGNKLSGILIVGEWVSPGAEENYVLGNFIGTNVDGTSALPNEEYGVAIFGDADHNHIGGTLTEQKVSLSANLISGNKLGGVLIKSKGLFFPSWNEVLGNYIGTNREGTGVLPNEGYGVEIAYGASHNWIGRYEGGGNIISGNKKGGVLIKDEDTLMNEVLGNFIGTNFDGTSALPNEGYGVEISDYARYTRIGGYEAKKIKKNIISGNKLGGVLIKSKANANYVLGNYIGTNRAGTNALPNDEYGVEISDGARDNWIGRYEGGGNIISGNKNGGVLIKGRYSDRNEILGNYIGTNFNGTSALPNEGYGVEISDKAKYTRIGGWIMEDYGNGNVISGNKKSGILIKGKLTGGSDVRGNYIGTNEDGTKLPNKEYGVEMLDRTGNNDIHNNTIWYNCGGIKEKNSGQNRIYSNSIKYNTCSTGIHLDNSGGEIIGNNIIDDEGDGIICENGSNPTIRKNNIFNNNGFGLKNTDPSVAINAQGNWWGDASGPGGTGSGSGDEVNGAVDFSSWRISPVALIASSGADTVFVKTGAADSISCFFQNWENLDDIINISVTDSLGWLQSSADFTLAFKDSMGADTLIYLTVPASAQPGTSSKLRINAVSTHDPSVQDADSLLVICYLSELERIVVSPDSIVVEPGATVEFRASGFDRKENDVIFEPVWGASSGVIDSTGLFTADSTEGTVTITVADGASPVQGTAHIQVSAAAPILTGIAVAPDSVTLNPGETKQFEAQGYDQFGMPINFSAQWSANGGTIDASGNFTASDETGTFTITATDTSANISGQAVVVIESASTVKDNPIIPDSYCLHQNYPNPFNPETTIRFDVKERTPVVLKIYDILGREVKVLVNSVHQPGSYKVNFDAQKMASGIYFYKIQMGSFAAVKKMLLLR